MNDEEARAQFFKQTSALGSTAFGAIFFSCAAMNAFVYSSYLKPEPDIGDGKKWLLMVKNIELFSRPGFV